VVSLDFYVIEFGLGEVCMYEVDMLLLVLLVGFDGGVEEEDRMRIYICILYME